MKKIWLALAVAVLMGVSLVGCGSASKDETPSVDETESAEAEDSAADESETADDTSFDEQWYEKSYFYNEETDEYFEICADESGSINVISFGDDVNIVDSAYLTTAPDAYTEDEDGGYKYYDDGSNFNSVMVYYPASDTLVIMAADGYTYNCQAVDTAYGTDAYGFANDSVWQAVGDLIQMDIQYVASKSTGESYYQISVDQYVVSTESITWEATGTYDAESNSLVFTDARNCDVAVYADGTTKETDVYTDASGSIYMDCNQRLYWEDEFGGLASCVFESDAIDYTYAVMEAGAIYGSYECSDGANTITADIWVGEMADGITFEVSTSDGQTKTFTGSVSYNVDPIYVFDMGDCSLEMIFIDNGETVRVVVDDGADEEYDVLAGYYTFTGESTYSDINWDEVS